MKILLAFLVGFVIALMLYLLSPLIQEKANRGRQRLYLWLFRHDPRLLSRAIMATMAVPADTSVRGTALPNSDVIALVTEHNNVVATLRLLTAKMDLDAGITDANWNALLTDSAVATAPKKVVPSF